MRFEFVGWMPSSYPYATKRTSLVRPALDLRSCRRPTDWMGSRKPRVLINPRE
jgi:hypothetical protein